MVLTKAQAKSLSILEVARSLGMEMKRNSHKEYYWTEHDSFKIDTVKNTWHWYSQTGKFGDTINLVQEIRNVSYKEAMTFLETGNFPEAKPMEEVRQPFRYTLAPYERPFKEARAYLKESRGLSDETIDFFLEKGVLAQARRRDRDDGFMEDVLVFKYLDRNQNMVGASLQGLAPYPERHEGKGYLKQTMYQSEGIAGLNVSIGFPKRLIVTEAPIDLMSYYELHKNELSDVRLVAMDGLKEGVLSRYAMEILQEQGILNDAHRDYTKTSDLMKTSQFLETAAQTSTLFQDYKYDDLITLAVDNDKAGTGFIETLQEKNIPVIDARPPKGDANIKMDWNEVLKQEKQRSAQVSHFERDSEALQETLTSQLKTYDEIKQENDELVKRLENRIKKGDLAISFDTDVYLYDVFAKLGNSHPFKYLNAKRLEVLAPLQPMLAAINDKTIDLYKNKGTMEQDALYQALAPHQRTLGVDISTRFIGELAIAAYSTNKQLDSLSMEHFGAYYGKRTLDNLSQSIERILEYPLNEIGTKDYTYSFVTTPNAFYHYLEEQEGEVVLGRSVLDVLLSRLEKRPLQVVEQKQEEVRSEQNEKSLDNHQETNTGGELFNRNSSSLEAEASGTAPQPVENFSQPDFPSNVQLHFTIDEDKMSNKSFRKNMRTLNLYANTLKDSAQWYLRELAGSSIRYIYKLPEENNLQILTVRFDKRNWMHLTGVTPVYHEYVETLSESFIDDVAAGKGHFKNLKFAPGMSDKLKVLNLLPEVIESDTFVFNDLSSVKKFNNLDLAQAINPEDTDLLLLFKENTFSHIPASLMRIKGELFEQLETIASGTVLGIYRERNGKLEQLSINEDHVKDGGEEFEEILKTEIFERYQEDVYKDDLAQHYARRDSDGDGISDEEELKQGTNPYDFRSTPNSKVTEETSLDVAESIGATSSLAIADFIKNKDIAGLNRHLKAGIKEYLNSDKYKDYLTKMSQLNNYSSRNLRLILAQNPEATQVASFKQWKETFNRHVKKGEKSIRIFAPMTKIKKDKYNQPILDKNGKPETVTFFGLVPVFDVSQTDGKELPKAISEVKEQVSDLDYANLYRALMTIAKVNNVSVRFEEMAGETKGYYNPAEHQIVLRSNDMNKSQLIKTFIHETAHSELHHANNPQQDQLTRSTAELQAESVAYVMSSYYGLDTSDYSFGYLASWSDDKETLADLEAQLDIVQQEAKSLMVRMDQQLEQLRLAQEKQTKYQFEQKLQKFKDQTKQAVEEHKQELKQEAQSKKEKGLSK